MACICIFEWHYVQHIGGLLSFSIVAFLLAIHFETECYLKVNKEVGSYVLIVNDNTREI